MFHIELRQFPHVAREFNLTAEDIQARITAPWVAGKIVELGERMWAPERARLTIYEGPELRTDEIGMGRGWSSVTRNGEDVTARVLRETQSASGREAELAELKRRLLELCAGGMVEVRESVGLAGTLHPGWRVSEQLSLAEQAVWELLHAGSLRMLQDGQDVRPDHWQPLLLAWSTWGETGANRIQIAVSS